MKRSTWAAFLVGIFAGTGLIAWQGFGTVVAASSGVSVRNWATNPSRVVAYRVATSSGAGMAMPLLCRPWNRFRS